MEQKKIEREGIIEAGDRIQVKTVKQLLCALDSDPAKRISGRLQKQLMGSDGLRLLAAAMTILLTDYGGTTPSGTCGAIADAAPSLYRDCGFKRVLAVCEEIQYSEIPKQSELLQRMFQRFNIRYFAGRLPDYKILAVYDVCYWETQRCGYLPFFPPACEAVGFIDFTGRQIFIRFLGYHTGGFTMTESLTHEMAHATTDGDHGANWQTETARLEGLGAPVKNNDFRRGAKG